MLFCLVYFTSYITRINYGTAVIDIADNLGITNAIAGIPVSLSFISYGVGQLIAGYLGDKFNSVKIISVGIALTATMNLSVAFTDNIYLIMVLWTVNGFAQSLLWPPLVKIMLFVFGGQQYKESCASVIMSASVATVLLYLLVPLCIDIYNYKAIFIISTILALLVLIIWLISMRNITLSKPNINNEKHSEYPMIKLISSLNLTPLLLVIVFQGMLRDGITTWTPAFISEMFNLSTSASILSSSALPIFSIVAVLITRAISRKFDNEVLLSSYYWCIAVFSGITLYFNMDSIIISLLALTLLTSCMHGTNLLLIGNLPAKFVKHGKVSTISGVLNSCTYIGSTISAYGIAKLAEAFGWGGNVIFWTIIATVATLICFFNTNLNKKILNSVIK